MAVSEVRGSFKFLRDPCRKPSFSHLKMAVERDFYLDLKKLSKQYEFLSLQEEYIKDELKVGKPNVEFKE
jgi:hypothetical protein